MGHKPKDIPEVILQPRPLLVYPPPLSPEKQVEFDRVCQQRMLQYPIATRNSGLGILADPYEK
mgnify:CR=1 FL=1